MLLKFVSVLLMLWKYELQKIYNILILFMQYKWQKLKLQKSNISLMLNRQQTFICINDCLFSWHIYEKYRKKEHGSCDHDSQYNGNWWPSFDCRQHLITIPDKGPGSQNWQCILTSSNGNIFRVTGHLCGRPVTRSFDVFFDLRLNKQLSKQWWGWWFSCHPAHYDVNVMGCRNVYLCYDVLLEMNNDQCVLIDLHSHDASSTIIKMLPDIAPSYIYQLNLDPTPHLPGIPLYTPLVELIPSRRTKFVKKIRGYRSFNTRALCLWRDHKFCCRQPPSSYWWTGPSYQLGPLMVSGGWVN